MTNPKLTPAYLTDLLSKASMFNGFREKLRDLAPDLARRVIAAETEISELKEEIIRLEQGTQGVNVEGLKNLAASEAQKNYDLKTAAEKMAEALKSAKAELWDASHSGGDPDDENYKASDAMAYRECRDALAEWEASQ